MKGRPCVDRYGNPCYRRLPSPRMHRWLQLGGLAAGALVMALAWWGR